MSAFVEEKEKVEMNLRTRNLSHIPSLRALAALLALSLRQQIRGWRIVVLALLFMIPAALVLMLKLVTPARANCRPCRN